MNAPSPALVAPRPERLRLVGQRRQILAVMHQRLIPEHSADEYFAMLRSGKPFFYLRRRASPDLVEAVNALGEPGLAIQREPDRLYPQTTLAAHVLGFTDIDGHGAGGVERAFD